MSKEFKTKTEGLTIRYVEDGEEGLVLQLIKEIAEYEKMSDDVVADPAVLEEEIFNKKRAEVIFAVVDGKEIGFALFFHNFSTFLGRSGLYLEDIYLLPEHRKKGYGKALFKKVASVAVERNCGRMEWCCLDWNQPSIDFYLSHGAIPMSEWTTYRHWDCSVR